MTDMHFRIAGKHLRVADKHITVADENNIHTCNQQYCGNNNPHINKPNKRVNNLTCYCFMNLKQKDVCINLKLSRYMQFKHVLCSNNNQ
jgi:hypothetical protein